MNKRRFGKIIMLMASAIVIVFVLSSCYMEPDRTIDNENNVGNDGQNFEALVTPTPTMTATPYVTETPEMTSTIEPTESEEPTESSGLNLGVFDTPSLDENVTPKVDAKTTSIPVPTKKNSAN